MAQKVLVVKSVMGKVESKDVVEGDIYEVVRQVTQKALSEWEPLFSDFVVVRDKYEVSLKLPLKPEDFERYSKFGLRRTPYGYAVFEVPVYLISYENEWRGDDYVDKKVYLVSLYVNDEIMNEMVEWAAEATREAPPSAGLLEVTEEELDELEELEQASAGSSSTQTADTKELDMKRDR
jgi:hypothetical protein